MTTEEAKSERALLPCPFCGGKARPIVGLFGCEPCAIARRTPESWNRRAPSDLVEALREAREALEFYANPKECGVIPVFYDELSFGDTATITLAKIDAALAKVGNT